MAKREYHGCRWNPVGLPKLMFLTCILLKFNNVSDIFLNLYLFLIIYMQDSRDSIYNKSKFLYSLKIFSIPIIRCPISPAYQQSSIRVSGVF